MLGVKGSMRRGAIAAAALAFWTVVFYLVTRVFWQLP